jgi:hypothetical protein
MKLNSTAAAIFGLLLTAGCGSPFSYEANMVQDGEVWSPDLISAPKSLRSDSFTQDPNSLRRESTLVVANTWSEALSIAANQSRPLLVFEDDGSEAAKSLLARSQTQGFKTAVSRTVFHHRTWHSEFPFERPCLRILNSRAEEVGRLYADEPLHVLSQRMQEIYRLPAYASP